MLDEQTKNELDIQEWDERMIYMRENKERTSASGRQTLRSGYSENELI